MLTLTYRLKKRVWKWIAVLLITLGFESYIQHHDFICYGIIVTVTPKTHRLSGIFGVTDSICLQWDIIFPSFWILINVEGNWVSQSGFKVFTRTPQQGANLWTLCHRSLCSEACSAAHFCCLFSSSFGMMLSAAFITLSLPFKSQDVSCMV